MILLFQPGSGGGTYVDYDFYQKFGSMEEAVKTAFAEVLTGMGNLGDVSASIAAIGASLYIGMRLLGHLARAESIDVFPLLRPFAIGFLALNFTIVTGFLDALIKPVENVTQNMVDIQTTRNQQIEQMRQQKIQERLAKLDKDMDQELDNWSIGQYSALLVEKLHLYLNEGFWGFIRNLFYILFLAARLVVLTTRAFFLVVLTIVGPLTFAAAIFNGFQDSHLIWMARYVQISLWFPLANILGAIVSYVQGKVIAIQYMEMTSAIPDEAASGEFIYVVIMVVATLAYLTIPTAASYIISSSGVGSALQRMTNMSTTMVMASMPAAGAAGKGALAVGGAIAGGVGSAATMGVGAAVVGGRAVVQTAQNYGNYYGEALKHEYNNLRNISKSSD
ncbi:conjugative transposon TraJ protein [Spirosoma oryzae]|uniref:Conjugative transposon TraJ protein n=1 Tax=Spirosoma oryzae TaxID=1469603 RepID=A0A2T0SNR5_9BACT|nr:hypothetical protein [Spirosoma oryzae]PRY35047.1 conjugative transposon TraJ protein [Spirosoma oryzae]